MRDGDDDEIAAKKAALAKALSAAYLEHQIADLENKVNAIGVSDSPGTATASKADASRRPEDRRHQPNRNDRERRNEQRNENRENPREKKDRNEPNQPGRPIQNHRGRIDDSSPSSSLSSSSDSEEEWEWRVAVVDVSALMWAPRSVRHLVQRGYEVIVPLDAIRTLDMLKKGNSPVAQAARAATRFVEHASRHWRPISTDPAVALQSGTEYKKGRGLRMQREEETATPAAAVMGDAPPKWVTSVLGCATFFTAISRAEEIARGWDDEPRPAVLIAHPPLSAEVGPPPVDERPDAPHLPPQQNLAERAEGYTISLEAGRFELGLEVLRDDEDSVEEPPPRPTRGRGRGRGGGRGRGRGGRNRQQEVEPEPVKILLRRPEPEGKPPTPAEQPPPSPIQRDDERRRGGRGRGGRGRGRPNTDRGGGFTLLQRPGPPLAHHVRGDPRDASPREATPREATPREATPREATPREANPREANSNDRQSNRSKNTNNINTNNGNNGNNGNKSTPRENRDRDKPDWPLRRAYASADADPVERPRVVLLQRPR